MAEENYCSEEIKILLQQAETRLSTSELRQHASPLVQRVPKLTQHMLADPYIRSDEDLALADSTRLLEEHEKRAAGQIRRVEDPATIRERLVENERVSTVEQWFNLPRTELTPTSKRDLRLMKMRGVLDPKRHYKQDSSKDIAPTFSQIATVIQGPTEFFNARLSQKDRKSTFVEEVLAAESATGRVRKKYGDIQATKTNGKKAFYKKLKERRASKTRRA
ncbi:uncharacterized protein KY384_003661 [Bacidia gigantensis]|uniref:uncharacterized protein n=1 Tax=Bacidia gigantensis TaxID=2732470 RepID=UPI001D03E819|nr:uncharacterized protein KY384_003661 [Bacidia gigantensis]KAG8532025.1 hypothetical protein KY384_003661 [Bacidia gigantensis]